MKIQELVNFWQNHQCPYCNSKNWTYHSHSKRWYTGHFLNTNACKCWNCKESYWLIEDIGQDPEVQDGRNEAH